MEKTVADLGLLAQLTSAANDTDVPQRLRDLIPQPQSERPDLKAMDAPDDEAPDDTPPGL
ncbi:hypothetical protein ACFVZM_07180 [Streptomyces sioyaensis]|uniref:hypothetical protein n=1 Tax=Streptomyces sioyaensis TaxID=67364 RepID=UPI00369F4D79